MKFSAQAEKVILDKMKKVAQMEGRKLQDVIDEAFKDYLEKIDAGKPRRRVMEGYKESLKEFGAAYKKLAE